MPTYLDFNSTKSFRDFVLSKTLSKPNGPQTFTQSTYSVQGTLDSANIDLPEVDVNRTEDLLQMQRNNVFKPLEFFVRDTFDVLPRRANLSLYPYFNMGNHTLISIMSTDNYDTESELFKFAARNIKENTDGPVFGRIKQNLATATTGRLRLLDALNGNIATATNIITGREPLIAPNYQITTAKTAPGQAIDFLQTVSGVEFPFSEIPGEYLTDPKNPINVRPTASTATGAFIQDVTGALGSLVGIQRRPSLSRKPSDTFIEYMGDGQRNVLYDLLSYSTYAPNYTTTARQQQSSKIFNFVQNIGQGVKNILGMEAPRGLAYIGDDRGNDIKFAMNDLNDRPVRSNFYLSLMFDPVQARLFERRKNVSEGGELGGRLTWTSSKSNNRLGANNKEWDYQQSEFNDSLSTNHAFRSDSILGITQEILDTLPSDAGAARSHVANVIDQTSRIFREGDVLMSRGSAIKYTDQYGQESGVEYCRVWTKDNAYYNYSDTMKRTSLIRKYDDSVLSTPWNLNITPVSNGNKSFEESTNIDPIEGKAKKYMFSIENLAWKTSTTPGFTVNDLPVCERGPNGGRIMWFPPYDLKVGEQNSARWESNTFLGRPEPIYTYQNTERSGQVSFKIVVDHPSVLNLLVREVFKNMSDEESENYINAFFAGCEEIDFYDLIRRYNTITPDDAKLIREFLNQGKDEVVIKNYRITTDDITEPAPNVQPNPSQPTTEQLKIELNFANDFPLKSKNEYESNATYSTLYNSTIGSAAWTGITLSELQSTLNEILSGTTTYNTANAVHDKLVLYGKNIATGDTSSQVALETSKLQTEINQATSNYQSYTNKLSTLKTEISEGKVNEITVTMMSSTSAVADNGYNYKLSIRRSHSIVSDIINQLKKDGSPVFKWDTNATGSPSDKTEINTEITFKELGYSEQEGKIKFRTINAGEEYSNENNVKCGQQNFKYESTNGYTLKISAPIAFGCRQTTLKISTVKTTNKQDNQNPKSDTLVPPKTKLVQSGETTVPSGAKRPQIDPLKRIITKTLSECFYFKKLEETDPVVFKSLKEKLKYFHPAFHSTTPEGLNARLTFLNQCVRPGETLPIKGLSDQSDLYARNTSFGPPPICVIRIGDFYHSKVVIRDVNITFDENVWDLNPEGIGVQPMIANVSLQVNFIGGHGLNEPVNKLQNALSSNFYANTEMYDERSVVRNASIGGSTGFTKTFLEQILKNSPLPAENNLSDKGDDLRTGDYIGLISGTTLTYKKLIDEVYSGTTNYFTSYTEMYNKLIPKYGNKTASIILSPIYRSVNDYDVYINSTPTSNTIDLFGEYRNGLLLSDLVKKLKLGMLSRLSTTDLCVMFGFDKDLSSPKQIKANELLNPYIKSFIEKIVDGIGETTNTKDFIETRNNFIQTLDKVNMVVKYGKDFLIDGQNVTEFTMSGFTSNLLYDEYSDCINFITGNTNQLYVDLDTTMDLKKPDITSNNFSELLSIWLKDYKNELLKVFEIDTLIFDNSTVEKLNRRLDKFITIVDTKKFKFKYPKRKNDVEVAFDIASDAVVTNSTTIEDIKHLFSNKLPLTNNKLNFYKP